MATARESIFVPLQDMATMVGVPKSWLKSEAEAERVPSLRVGRRLMFNPIAVKHALLVRAEDQYLFDPSEVERVLIERARRGPKEGSHD